MRRLAANTKKSFGTSVTGEHIAEVSPALSVLLCLLLKALELSQPAGDLEVSCPPCCGCMTRG